MRYNFGILTSKKGYEMIKIHNRRFGYNRAGGGDLPLKILWLQSQNIFVYGLFLVQILFGQIKYLIARQKLVELAKARVSFLPCRHIFTM